MNLRDLEYVEAVGSYLSFSKAAMACNVSQPALSNQVKKLERELGAQLFDRRLQEVRPTELGTRVIASARSLLAEAQRIRDMATEYRDPAALPLRIGMVPTLAPYLMGYLCEQIQIVWPDIKLAVTEAPSAELIRLVGNRDIDIALIPRRNCDRHMDFSPVFREQMCLAIQSNHPLSKLRRISLADIPYHKLICPRTPFGFDAEDEIMRINPGIGCDVSLDVSGAGLETICRHISVSSDCSMIPALAADRFRGDGWNLSFVPIADQSCSREIGINTRVGCPRKPLLAAVLEQFASNPPVGVELIE